MRQRHSHIMTRIGIAAFLAATAAIPGCGDSDRLPTYTVTGKVVFPDGSPLAGALVTFRSAEHNLSANGRTEADGTFSLSTYEVGDGAIAGAHHAAVVPEMNVDVDPDEYEPTPVIHQRFQDLDASGLEFTVSEDGPNDFSLLVDKK